MKHTYHELAEPLPTRDEIVAIVKGGISRRQPPDEPYHIKSGISWVYCDEKRAVSSGERLRSVGRYAVAELQAAGVAFSAVGGLTMGATPFAIAIATDPSCNSRWFEVCKAGEPYDRYDQHHPQRTTATRFVRGDRILIAEDVTSTGGSALEAAGIIRDVCAEQEVEDVAVVGVVTMLDRGRVAAERFAQAGLAFVALTNYEDVGIEPVN